MNERDLYQFLAVTEAYFYRAVGNSAQFEVGSIEFNSLVFSEVTGLIGIKGEAEGLVYLTATHDMLHELLRATGYRGTSDREQVSRNFMQEILEEIKAQVEERFDSRLQLAAPLIFTTVPDDPIELPPTIYISPIDWKNHQGYFGLGLVNTLSPVNQLSTL